MTLDDILSGRNLRLPPDPNNDILEANRAEIERRMGASMQAGIDYANSLIDTRLGIVGGDGSYWPRAGFPRS